MRGSLSLKIGVTGVRGIVGESLTPQLVTSFAAAFGTYCGAGPIVLGSDTRPSRQMVTQAVEAGLLSVGCTPVELGIVPTPALQHHLRRLGAFGGIAVTASHNPIQWNALKFFGPDGIALRENQAAELTDLYHQGLFPRAAAHEISTISTDGDAIAAHLEMVLGATDTEALRARRFKVAMDACNGAASVAAPLLLSALGCEVVRVHCDVEQPFPHDPEPIPENLGDLGRAVVEHGCDLGFGLDADGDRLALTDEHGRPLGEDCTIALCLRHVLPKHPGPTVVNASTSRLVDDVATACGCQVERTKVGEIHVIERLLELGCAIGGEGNGGVILPRLNPCRDSSLAMSLVLESLVEFGGPLSALRATLPHYAIVKHRLPCPLRAMATALRRMRYYYRDETQELVDGVKVVWADRWLHARASNTEPLIRIIAEAPTEAEANTLAAEAAECLRPREETVGPPYPGRPDRRAASSSTSTQSHRGPEVGGVNVARADRATCPASAASPVRGSNHQTCSELPLSRLRSTSTGSPEAV